VRKEQEERKKKMIEEKEKEIERLKEIRRELMEDGINKEERKVNIKGLRKKWRARLAKRSTRNLVDIEDGRDEVETVALKMI
jgi:hypothetical protein